MSELRMNVNNSKEKLHGFFTIKNSLFFIVSILIVIVMSFGISAAIDASNYESEMAKAIVINEFSDDLIEASNHFSIERGVMVIALGSDKAISPDFRAIVDENRAKGIKAYQEAMGIFEGLGDFPSKKKMASEIAATFKKYMEEQEVTDQLSTVSYADEQDNDVKSDLMRKRGKVSRNFRRSIDALDTNIHELRLAVEFENNISNSQIIMYQELKNTLAEMMEYTDREWASMGAAISAEQPISHNMISAMSSYVGRVDSSWDRVNALLGSSKMDKSLKGLLTNVNSEFFENFRGLKDEVYDASYAADASGEGSGVAVKANYPVNVVEWVKRATAATETVQDLSEAVGSSARQAALTYESEARTDLITGLIVLLFTFAIGCGAFWLVAIRIARPLSRLGVSMSEISKGDLEAEIEGTDRQDEIGLMARSLQVFKEAAIEKIHRDEEEKEAAEVRRVKKEQKALALQEEEREARRREEEQAIKISQERKAEMMALADNFESSVMDIVTSVAAASREMEDKARDMSSQAETASHQATAVSAASEQTNSNIQTVASAAEELSLSVKEISEQVAQSNTFANNAVIETGKATEEMKGLVDAAQKIGEVINLISDIAEQTNLLALNATIEAARAGEAGRGFAVVASEVKSLANQTATATDEITKQVDSMQKATEKAVNAIDSIQNVIKRIDEASISISSAVEEQDASTHEIARNVSEVSAGTQEVTSNIHVINDGAKTTGVAAKDVLESARNMSDQSTKLRDQLDQFLQKIRVA